jgi:hypothetical protein
VKGFPTTSSTTYLELKAATQSLQPSNKFTISIIVLPNPGYVVGCVYTSNSLPMSKETPLFKALAYIRKTSEPVIISVKSDDPRRHCHSYRCLWFTELAELQVQQWQCLLLPVQAQFFQ